MLACAYAGIPCFRAHGRLDLTGMNESILSCVGMINYHIQYIIMMSEELPSGRLTHCTI